MRAVPRSGRSGIASFPSVCAAGRSDTAGIGGASGAGDQNGLEVVPGYICRPCGDGAEAVAGVSRTASGAHDMGIKWLTLFAFSTENWRRPQAEVDYLMRFNQRVIRNNAPRWHSMGIRLRYLGALDAPVPDFGTRCAKQ